MPEAPPVTRADMPGFSSISPARWGETDQLQASERAREARGETGARRGGYGQHGRPAELPRRELSAGGDEVVPSFFLRLICLGFGRRE